MYSHDEMAVMMGEMKFTPSFDMSKIMTESGKTFLQLKSIYHYYDFRTGMEKNNIDNLSNGNHFSVIVKSIDGKTKADNNNNNDTSNESLPTHSCIQKCPNNGKVNVFIPYCELIPIYGE